MLTLRPNKNYKLYDTNHSNPTDCRSNDSSDNPFSRTTDSYQAQLYKVYAQEKTERPDKRQREHPAPILCHISVTDGIRIPGINVSEIESFEIYDTEGNCVAAYSSEQEFIDTLPTLHGEYQLCFVTDDFDLRGWIYLN